MNSHAKKVNWIDIWLTDVTLYLFLSIDGAYVEVLPHKLRVWLFQHSERARAREREVCIFLSPPYSVSVSLTTRRLRDLRQQRSRAPLPRQSRITRLVVPSPRLPLPESRACRIPGKTLTWNRSCASAGDGSATLYLLLLPVTNLREISSAAAAVVATGGPHPAVISPPSVAAIAPAALPVPVRVTATLPPTLTTIESLRIRVQTVGSQRRQWWLMHLRVLGPWASRSAGAPRRRLGSSRLTRAPARAWSRSSNSKSSSSRSRRSSSPRVYQTSLALETRRTIITWSLTPARAGMASITGVVPVEHSRALVPNWYHFTTDASPAVLY